MRSLFAKIFGLQFSDCFNTLRCCLSEIAPDLGLQVLGRVDAANFDKGVTVEVFIRFALNLLLSVEF